MSMDELRTRIEELERLVKQGVLGGQMSIGNLIDFIPTVSAAPTHKPHTFQEQFRIYKDGATLRFYWYDVANTAWHYVDATA